MIGQTIGHYQITAELGTGGMGAVYRADDLRLQRAVAMKFVSPHLSRDPEAHQRLLREARSASALDHPHIGVVYEVAETDDGQLYIVMALYEGGTLRQRLDQGSLPIEEAVRLGRQIAEGLAAAHAAGIVHRDLKPENILLTRDGQVRIVDFGLAKSRGQTRMTRTSSAAGTVAYMSPEQARGDEVDARTDLFSLGVILYEMLGGRPPFRGESDSAVLYQLVHEEPPRLEGLRSEVPRSLRQLVVRLLAKDPAGRYPDAVAVLADLRRDRVRRRWPRRRAFLAAAGTIAFLSMATWWAWPRYLSETARFKREIVRLQNDNRPLVIAVAPFNATGEGAPQQADMLRAIAMQELNRCLVDQDRLQVVTGAADDIVSSHAEARRACDRMRVDALLWGEVIDTGHGVTFQPYLTVMPRLLLGRANFAGSQLDMDQPVALVGDGTPLVDSVRSLATLVAAGLFVRQGRADQALSMLDATQDESLLILLEKIELYRQLGRYDKVEATCRSAILEYPDQPEPNRALAAVLLSMGRAAEAESAARRAVELSPENADMVYMLAGVYRDQGRYMEARHWHVRGLELASSGSAEALRVRGQHLLYLGRPNEAVVLFKKSLVENPYSRRARDSLRNSYMYLGRYEDAERESEILLQMFPEFPPHQVQHVRVLLARSRYKDAERFYSLAPQTVRDDAQFANLGAILALFRRDGSTSVTESRRARALAPTMLTMAVNAWLARRLLDGEDAAVADLLERANSYSDDRYVRGTIDFLTGQCSEQALLACAESPDSQVQRNQRCEAYYLLAMRRILSAEAGGPNADTDLTVARNYFAKCIESSVKGYTEHIFARLELERLRVN